MSEALIRARATLPEGTKGNLILVVLPDDTGNKTTYFEIKRVADTVLGVTTQCFKPKWIKNMSRNAHKRTDRTLFSNLLLKINVKLGGLNTRTFSALPVVSEKPTMLVGIDVTHPPPGAGGVSIAAVVASMDRFCSQYRTAIVLQDARQEVLTVLNDILTDLLRLFLIRNSTLPERIIVYRDGVSEGQFQTVLDSELASINAAADFINAQRKKQGHVPWNPKVTFIVVQKRHHTRFFFNSRDSDRNGNALPGTVIDTGVVSPDTFEFYLYSHPGLQGTSRPTKYQVLYDQSGFGSDALQALTNQLCYLFARCQRAVSNPPPSYYAHLVADRARCHVRGEFSDVGSMVSGMAETGLETIAEELRVSGMWFM